MKRERSKQERHWSGTRGCNLEPFQAGELLKDGNEQ